MKLKASKVDPLKETITGLSLQSHTVVECRQKTANCEH